MDPQAETWMRRALELAENGRGHVEPNPLVGAVLVREGQVVGEGWHERFGQAHAEVNAIAQAGDRARGATLYVTLEPCCHHGKTPPCTEAILRAGIAEVVAAMADPFPPVAGQGAEQLRAAGVPFTFGLCEAEARRLNAPYLTLLSTGRPYVHAKWAMTLDGKIATRTGDSKWISGEASRRQVHLLRGRMDAVVVGIGTALADDPLLTARPPGPRTPCRVVLDSRARLPLTSNLVRTARQTPTMVVVTEPALGGQKVIDLKAAGCEVVSAGQGERVDAAAWLTAIGARRWTNVLVEGGGDILGSFLDGDLIDAFHVFLAPKLVGGSAAKGAVGGQGVRKMVEAIRLAEVHWEALEGGDFYVRARR